MASFTVIKKTQSMTISAMERVNQNLFKSHKKKMEKLNENSFSFSNSLVTIREYKQFFKFIFHQSEDIGTGAAASGAGGIVEHPTSVSFSQASQALFDSIHVTSFPHREKLAYSESNPKERGIYYIAKKDIPAYSSLELLPHIPDTSYLEYDKEDITLFPPRLLSEMIDSVSSLSYQAVTQLFHDIMTDIVRLQNAGFTLNYLTLDNIFCMNGRFVLLFDHKMLQPIIGNTSTQIFPYFTDMSFLAPEIHNAIRNKTMPGMFNISCLYYSLGLLCVHCLFGPSKENKETLLDQILDTKLYFSIQRCLKDDPSKRILIYV